MTLRTGIVTLIALAAVTLMPSDVHAQATVTAASAYTTIAPETPNAKGRWDFTFTATGIGANGGNGFLQIVIDVKLPIVLSVLEDRASWDVSASPTGAVVFMQRSATSGTTVLRVRAEGLLTSVKNGAVQWSAQHSGSPATVTGSVQGPVAVPAPQPRWSTVVGGGFSYLKDDFTDFEVDKDVLVIKNDSRLRATALTGIAFQVGTKVGLLAGLEYTAGTTALLDAFSAGLMYRLNDDVSVVVGMARAKGRELSAGFERAAAAYVKANPTLFKTIEAEADGSRLKKPDQYDGLPLKDIGYQGRVITDSWNTSLFVGVAFPITIKLGSDKDRAAAAKEGGK